MFFVSSVGCPIGGLWYWVGIISGVSFWFWYPCKFPLSLRFFWFVGGFKFSINCFIGSKGYGGSVLFGASIRTLFPCDCILPL